MRHSTLLTGKFHNHLLELATAQPETIALQDDAGSLRYRELPGAIQQWVEALNRLQVNRVAFCVANSIEWACLDLALLFSEKTAIPIPDFFTPEQQAYLLRASGADVLITDSLDSESQPLPEVDCARLGFTLLQPNTPPRIHEDTAKITFTSGSTGQPKGVCLESGTLLQTARSLVGLLRPLDVTRHLSVLPLSLLLENVAGLYANLMNGSTIHIPELESLGLRGSSGLDPLAFAAAQQHHQPQSLILVPQLLLALTALAEHAVPLATDYRFIAVGGAKVSPSLLQRARDAGLPAYEGYGLTECGSVIAMNHPAADRPGSVGRPLPHVELAIRQGEVVVERPRMLGYLGEPPGHQPIATGDCASLDEDGYLRLAGRRRYQITTSFGRNLAPEWVESELQSELPIGFACLFGDSEPANVALIGRRGEATADEIADAIARCNARLPDYARIARWHLLDSGTLIQNECLTANGRPKRESIAQAFESQLTAMFQAIRKLQNDTL